MAATTISNSASPTPGSGTSVELNPVWGGLGSFTPAATTPTSKRSTVEKAPVSVGALGSLAIESSTPVAGTRNRRTGGCNSGGCRPLTPGSSTCGGAKRLDKQGPKTAVPSPCLGSVDVGEAVTAPTSGQADKHLRREGQATPTYMQVGARACTAHRGVNPVRGSFRPDAVRWPGRPRRAGAQGRARSSGGPVGTPRGPKSRDTPTTWSESARRGSPPPISCRSALKGSPLSNDGYLHSA